MKNPKSTINFSNPNGSIWKATYETKNLWNQIRNEWVRDAILENVKFVLCWNSTFYFYEMNLGVLYPCYKSPCVYLDMSISLSLKTIINGL